MKAVADRTNQLRLLGCLGIAGLVLGCGTSSQPQVKSLASEIQAPAPAPPATADPASLAAPGEIVDEVVAAKAPPSTKEILDKSLEWATEGLRLYLRRDYDTARESLNDARILLLEADMPEFWKQQGLAVLQPGLPDDLKRYDLSAVARELEQVHVSAADQAEKAYVERELRRILRLFGDSTPQERYLPVLVDETHQYIEFYRGRHRAFFERAYLRRHKYWPVIKEVFSAHRIPIELGYIAFVESGFNPRAVSHANAIGLWQFIPETGRRYGLAEREDFHDVRKSTEAASGYLLDLIGIFGSPSFLLATAAYNTGEGRIVSCLRQLDNPFEKRSFWEIRPCLAAETREYVPRILAAAVLAGDPKRFGFDLPTDEDLARGYEVVTLPQVTSVAALAEMAGVAPEDLRAANSELDSGGGWTPGRNFPLAVPRGTAERLVTALATAPPAPAPERYAAVPARDRSEARKTHVVKRGETASSIARRYGLSLDTLASRNGLRRPYMLLPGQRLVVSGGSAGGSAAAERRDEGSGTTKAVLFTVKRGHTLSQIAELFAVSQKDLMRWNNLKGSNLRAGQTLRVHPGRRMAARTYKVKSGDKPASIAKKFGISVNDLLVANGLEAGSRLKSGQQLVFYVPA